MEALIKSPSINECAVDLYPQLSESAKLSDKPGPTPATKVAAGEGLRSSPPLADRPSPAPSRQDTRHLAEADDGNAQLKEQLEARLASLKEAEAKAVADGYEKGYAKGIEAGRLAGEKGYAAAVEALALLVDSSKRSISDLLLESEKVIAAIVFEAVCKIIGQEMTTPEGCAAVVRQVVAKANRDEIVSVIVSPKDRQVLERLIADEPEAPGNATLALLPLETDDRVELGGCMLTLKNGSIDGRIETQFRAFAQSLKDAAK